MNTFEAHLITPSGKAFEGQVAEALLPTPLGQIGILRDHVRYAGLLEPGFVKVGSEQFLIGGGFCIFDNNKLSILADSVIEPGSVKVENISKEIDSLSKQVESLTFDDPKAKILRKEIARLSALEVSLERL